MLVIFITLQLKCLHLKEMVVKNTYILLIFILLFYF